MRPMPEFPCHRGTFVVGYMRPRDVPEIAYLCAWCNEWFTPEDEAKAERGAIVSHGIHRSCAARELGEAKAGGAA